MDLKLKSEFSNSTNNLSALKKEVKMNVSGNNGHIIQGHEPLAVPGTGITRIDKNNIQNNSRGMIENDANSSSGSFYQRFLRNNNKN